MAGSSNSNSKGHFQHTNTKGHQNTPTPNSRLFNYPGFCDTEDRKKARAEDLELIKTLGRFTISKMLLFKLFLFVCVLTLRVLSTNTSRLDGMDILNLHISVWSMLWLFSIVSHLVSPTPIKFISLVVEKLACRKNAYFWFATERESTNILWHTSVLGAWCVFLDLQEKKAKMVEDTLQHITKALICLAIASLFWMVKAITMRIHGVEFAKVVYFEKIKSVLFKQSVIRSVLARNPRVDRLLRMSYIVVGEFEKRKGEKELWDKMEYTEWNNLNQYKISAWTIKRFAKIIRYGTLKDELKWMARGEAAIKGGTGTLCDQVATCLSVRFFEAVSQGRTCITGDDLKNYMPEGMAEETVEQIQKLNNEKIGRAEIQTLNNETIGRAEIRAEIQTLNNETIGSAEIHTLNNETRIGKDELTAWVICSFKERRNLELTLSDTHAAFKRLNRIASFFVIVMILVMSGLVFLKNNAIKVGLLVFLISQFAVSMVNFAETINGVVKSLAFFFLHRVMVGNACNVEGQEMIVEELGLLQTKFFRSNDNVTNRSNFTNRTNSVLLTQSVHVYC